MIYFIKHNYSIHSSQLFYDFHSSLLMKIMNDNNIKYDFVDIKNENEIDNIKENDYLILNSWDICILLLYVNKSFSKYANVPNRILIWGENFDANLKPIGWNFSNALTLKDELFLNFFKTTKHIICHSYRTKIILNNLMLNNVTIFPLTSYSKYLKTSLDEKLSNEKTIDILIYGCLSYDKRLETIKAIVKCNSAWKIVMYNNLFDEELQNHILAKSKLVVHVNSFDNLTHIPWAKIGKLISNNSVFLIEYCEELHNFNLIDKVNHYKNHSMLCTKIKDILNNYDYYVAKNNDLVETIKKDYNFDEFYGDLFSKL